MSDWRQDNPGRDRRLWGEPRRHRGRVIVGFIGVPLLIGVLGVSTSFASDAHLGLDMNFGPGFMTVSTPTPRNVTLVYLPSSSPSTGAPPAASAKPGHSRTHGNAAGN